MKNPTPQDGEHLQKKITKLIEHLEDEISTLKAGHANELQILTNRCRSDIQTLHIAFSNELDQIENSHQAKLASLVEEIAYLKEMSHSQRLMMETNLEYIRELEFRYSNLKQAKKP